MARVWYVKNRPFPPNERETPEAYIFQANCIRDCRFGMGWYRNDLADLGNCEINAENAENVANVIGNPRSFSTAQGLYLQMQPGDVAITFLNKNVEDDNGTQHEKGYYYGTISAVPKLNDYTLDNPRFSWSATVTEWNYWGLGNELPHHVQGALSGNIQRNTVVEIRGFAAITILEKAGVTISGDKPQITSDNFYISLAPNDLEDLMADYMMANNSNYIFLPSSCKQSTQDIEFVMYDRSSGNRITCQTKVNARINVNVYTSDYYITTFDKIYLFSGAGYSPRNYEEILNNQEHIICVSREDMFNTLYNNKIYRPIVEKYFTFVMD